ncbi:hypothetical protein G5B47_08150 [Paenibacillus sp. 7124]|uniref:Uncharacterized protein n=1 Tax=Paenibacillus apii TaxID=1850370 RepID=A0A6M1PGQ7_9BACL|nr:DUF6056 family protein [Paenibacillus apii]NGM82386.1 hypothetical protein [Paenibacillus apii]NJJ39522.1 hypothetical protein [Paenibacillus apii]
MDKKKYNDLSLKVFAVFIIIYFYHFIIKIAPGDDFYFKEVSNQFSFFDYLDFRYHEWTGRMSAEAGLYFFLDGMVWMWRIINSILILLLSYGINRLIRKEFSFSSFIIILVCFGYLSPSILSSGVLWITGSIVYLWPISLGVFAMIPFSDLSLRGARGFTLGRIFLSLCMGLLAILANEQVALCMLGFGALAIFHSLVKNRILDKRLILLWLVYLTAFMFSFYAPGNHRRFIAETATWFPGFDNLSLRDHLYIGIIWIYSKVFIQMKFLILLLSIITLCFFYIKKKNASKLVSRTVSLFAFLVISSVSIALIGNVEFIYDFEALKKFDVGYSLLHLWNSGPQFVFAIIPYVFWTIYTVLFMVVFLAVTKKRKFTLVCFLASIASMGIMFFSPTIYASGNRTLTVSAMLLIVIIANLISDLDELDKRKAIYVLLPLALINVLALLVNWAINGYAPILG